MNFRASYGPTSAALLVALIFLSACTSSQLAQLPSATVVDVAGSSKLRFAVGTATIGAANGQSVLGLNMTATFRNRDGNNATNTNTPTITGPSGFSFGPIFGNTNSLTGFTNAQYVQLETALVAGTNVQPQLQALAQGLGPYVGVFGYGFAADNRFAIDDSQIQAHLPAPDGGSACEGVAFPGYLNVGGSLTAGGAIGGTPTAGTGGGGGSFYGSVGSAIGTLPSLAPPAPGTVAEVERSAELSLPLASGNGIGGGGSGTCTCPQYCAPIGTPLSDIAFPIQAFGGPPAWPSPQGYGNYNYFVGYPSGFTDVNATPVAGQYQLSVSYPTNADYTKSNTLSASATLATVAGLPRMPSPQLKILPDGSGVITGFTIPPGVLETIIFLVTSDCDLAGREFKGNGYFNHYAFVLHTTGPQPPIGIPANLGPPGIQGMAPTHTFCTTGDIAAELAALSLSGTLPTVNTTFFAQAQAVGFDYPAYESSYPFATSQTPTIASPSGQADLTSSYPFFQTYTVPAPSPTGT